jgi:acyl-homoserine-lactone acylase
VANSNGSPWLINPAQPLSFPRIIGATGTDQPPRERLAFDMIDQRITGADGLGTPGFTVPALAAMALNDRGFFAEQWRDDLVRFCRAHPTLTGSAGTPVDVRAACGVLAGWDLRADLDSRGEVLFREFFTALASGGASLPPEQQWAAVPFDPAHPLTTPHGLNTALPAVGRALADAVTDMTTHGVALDAPLHAVQQVSTPTGPIPVPGCPNACYNIVAPARPNLTAAGMYPDIMGGASFLMAVRLTPGGAHAQTILTYGESENPASPHHWDQARLFSTKQWITERFTEAEIKAAPGLTVTVLPAG